MITLKFKTKPIAKPRPYFSKKSQRLINPANIKAFEKEIALLAKAQYKKPVIAPEIALEIYLIFTLKRPKTVKREAHTVAPDLSNLIKAIEDALNGIVYHDDKQIIKIVARKEYGEKDEIICQIYEA